MRPGPWRSVLRTSGYAVQAGETFLLHTDRFLPRAEQRDLARAVIALPDLLELLTDLEDYFGDKPASDKDALKLHKRMTKLMEAANIELRSA